MDPASERPAGIAFGRFEVLPDQRDVLADGRPVKVGGRVVKEWPSIKLEPNASWQATTALSPAPPQDATVEALLYRSDQPGAVYRHVELAPPARTG